MAFICPPLFVLPLPSSFNSGIIFPSLGHTFPFSLYFQKPIVYALGSPTLFKDWSYEIQKLEETALG